VGHFEFDEWQLVLLSDQPRDLRLGDDLALDENLAEAPSRNALLTGAVLLVQDRFEILLCHESVPDEEDAECGPGVGCGFHRLERYRPADEYV
jgi:hypothetical protein